jgi:putative ABC transport system ATP-binding protein
MLEGLAVRATRFGTEMERLSYYSSSVRRFVGLIPRVGPQNPFSGMALKLTIAKDLSLAARRGCLRFLGWALTSGLQSEMRQAVARLNMGLEVDNTIGSLSGGQRQGITLLMATWLKPHLLLLGEHRSARSEKRRPGDHPHGGSGRKGSTDHAHGHALVATGDVSEPPRDHHAPGTVIHGFRCAEKRRLRVADLMARFEEVRRAEQLAESATEMIRAAYGVKALRAERRSGNDGSRKGHAPSSMSSA